MDGLGLEIHIPLRYAPWKHIGTDYVKEMERIYTLLPELKKFMNDLEDVHRYGLLLTLF